MSIVLGLDAKLYRGAVGATAETEMQNVKDVTLNMESGEADVTTRKAKGWRMSVATLKSATVEFVMNYDTEDSDFDAIQAAFFSNTAIALFITDGNGVGLDADFTVLNFNVSQPLEEAMSVSVTVKPTDANRAPSWKTGAGS